MELKQEAEHLASLAGHKIEGAAVEAAKAVEHAGESALHSAGHLASEMIHDAAHAVKEGAVAVVHKVEGALRHAYLGETVLFKVEEGDTTLLVNGLQPGEFLPATVVRVWSPNLVNLKVHADGPLSPVWKLSVKFGEQPGQFKFAN